MADRLRDKSTTKKNSSNQSIQKNKKFVKLRVSVTFFHSAFFNFRLKLEWFKTVCLQFFLFTLISNLSPTEKASNTTVILLSYSPLCYTTSFRFPCLLACVLLRTRYLPSRQVETASIRSANCTDNHEIQRQGRPYLSTT